MQIEDKQALSNIVLVSNKNLHKNFGLKVGLLSAFDVFGEGSLLSVVDNKSLPRRNATVIVESDTAHFLKLFHGTIEALAKSAEFGFEVSKMISSANTVNRERVENNKSKIFAIEEQSMLKNDNKICSNTAETSMSRENTDSTHSSFEEIRVQKIALSNSMHETKANSATNTFCEE